MGKFLRLSTLVLAIGATNAFAHHPAADIVDEDVYAMIDSNVADTPHATMTFDEMGGGMAEMSVTADSLEQFQAMIADQYLLENIELLDGVVNVSIQFNIDSSVTMTVNQVR